jgi:hypothetical protein
MLKITLLHHQRMHNPFLKLLSSIFYLSERMRNILKDRTAFKILFIFFHELFLEHMVWILQGVQKKPPKLLN